MSETIPTPNTTKARVLVVEDESIVRWDIENTLKENGHSVVASCASGEEAIELCDEHRPQVVLMDIALSGGITGIEAAKQIRERTGSAVVFLTANSDKGTVSRARAAVPYGYVIKPFRPVDLMVAIEMALHNHGKDSSLRRERDDLRMRLAGEGDQAALFITIKGRQQRVLCREIRFVQALKDYVGIQVGARRYVVYSTMAGIEQRLPQDQFLRVHRSYIVRVGSITAIEDYQLLLEDGEERIPIGGLYMSKVRERLQLDGALT